MNRVGVWLAVLALIGGGVLAACAGADPGNWVQVDRPEGVVREVENVPEGPLPESATTRESFNDAVDNYELIVLRKQNEFEEWLVAAEQWGRNIDEKGQLVSGIRGLLNDGLGMLGEVTGLAGVPGGGLITAGLGLLGGWLLKDPRARKREEQARQEGRIEEKTEALKAQAQ